MCSEHGWKYREEWLRLSKWEQVHWIAYYKVMRDLEKEAYEEAKQEAKR